MRLDDKNAWIAGVTRCLSPNCDDRPSDVDIDLLVIHSVSLPPGEFGTPFVEALFCNRLDRNAHPYFARIADFRVSAHLFIRRSGALVQFVPFTRRAWHAGESAFCGRTQCNDFSVGIELEGADDVPYEDVQYVRLIDVARLLMSVWPDISPGQVVGHCDIAPGRKTDPGPGFDWARVRAALG
jgi:AmpD protein